MKKFLEFLFGGGSGSSITVTNWMMREEKKEDRISFVLRVIFILLDTIGLLVAWIFKVHAPASLPLVRQILSLIGTVGSWIGISASAVVWIIHVIFAVFIMGGKSLKPTQYIWRMLLMWIMGIIFFWRVAVLGWIITIVNAIIMLIPIYLDLNDKKPVENKK